MAKMSRTDEYGAQSRGQTFVYDPDDLTLIDDPTHPLYDPSVHEPPREEMVQGIMEHGVLKPICIRRNGSDSKGRAIIEVVDGRMRVKAARIANQRLRKAGKATIQVEAKLQKGLRDHEAESAMILLNEHQRVEDIVTRAEKLKRYLAHGHTEKQARMAFGMRARNFNDLMAVLEMSDALRDALRNKTITFEIAKKLAALPESKQAAALQAMLDEAGGKGRGEAAKAAADKHTGNHGKKKERVKPVGLVLKAYDNVSCMPEDKYAEGVRDALDWLLGRVDKVPPQWAPLPSAKPSKAKAARP